MGQILIVERPPVQHQAVKPESEQENNVDKQGDLEEGKPKP